MNQLRWISLLAVVAFAACGGDDDKKNDDNDDDGGDDGALTGTFSGVANLHYATPSRSGLTNAQGEFRYLAGETVTFSVGGVTLGSTAGADRVTAFTLYGATPPSTATALETVLNDRLTTDFDRAANVVAFLYVLDADRDATNGLDLGNADTALADATLSFDHEMRYFARGPLDRFASYHASVYRFVPADRGLSHFYASEGIVVPAQRLLSGTSDSNDDGTIDATTVWEYDAQNREIAMRRDGNRDGAYDVVNTATYDANGATNRTYLYDNDFNGIFETSQVYIERSNAIGNLIEQTYTSTLNGTVNNSYVYAATYTDRGDFLRTTRDADENSDDIIDRLTEIYTNDERGNRTRVRFESDYGINGTVDTYEVADTTYDANNNMVTSERLSYDATNTLTGGYRFSYEYDALGHLTREEERQLDASGTVVQIRTTTRTSNVSNRDLHIENAEDSDADGEPDSVSTYDTEYDPVTGRIAKRTNGENGDANDVIDYVAVTTWTYDATGNVIEELTTTDGNNDGVIENATRTVYTNSPDGVQTGYRRDSDNNGDGTFGDNPSSGTSSYENIANGAAMLIHAAFFDDER